MPKGLRSFRHELFAGISGMSMVFGVPALAQVAGPPSAGVPVDAPAKTPATSQEGGVSPTDRAVQVAPDASQIGDIIVTAQKRSQTLNSIGISINAADGDQLANLGVRDTGDLVKISPGLTFQKSQDGTPLFTIRGVGFNDYTLGASPAVSVYVDQMPLTYSNFTQGATLDLERVEVLKGPQGILFGQNSTGGAINYIAAKPTDTMEAGVKGSFGRFDTLDAEAFVSGPITENLGIRVAGGTTQSGPWQSSYTRSDKLGRQNIVRGRVQLEWKPTSTLSFLASVNGWHNDSDTQAAQLVGLKLQQDASAPGLYDPVETRRRIAAFRNYPLAPNNARAADWDPNRDLSRNDGMIQTSLRADWEVGSGVTVTSLTSYTDFDQSYGVDRDGTVLENAGVQSDGKVKSFFQELRVSGNTSRLDWIIGGNLATNKVTTRDLFLVNDSTNTAILPGIGVDGATTTLTQDIRDLAGFANVEYKIFDKVTLLAGGRYTDSKNDSTSCIRGNPGHAATFYALSQLISGVAQTPPDPSTCVAFDSQFLLSRVPTPGRLKENNFSWRLGANYQPTRDFLFYGLASRGYKSGSFPTIPASQTSQYQPVTQESVTAYEAGIKATLFDRKVQMNVAAFHYDYKNKQIRGAVIDPIFNQLEQLVNLPKSRINGAEIDVTLRPVSGLTLRAAGTYVTSKVLEFTGINNDRVNGDYRGSALPFSPKWQVLGDVQYEFPVTSTLNAFLGGNVLHNTRTNSTLGDPASSRIRNFTTLDLRAGVNGPGDRWSLSVWGRNVTNEYYWTNQFATQDVIVRYAAMPATYGVSTSVRF